MTAAHALAAALLRDAPARDLAVGADVPFEDAAADPDVRVVHSPWAHGLVPVMHLHKALRVARLPRRDPDAPPPWRAVVREAPRVTHIDALPAEASGSLDPDDGVFADRSPFDEWSVAAPAGASVVVRVSAPGTFEGVDPMLVRVEGDGVAWCDDAAPGTRDRGEARAARARWRASARGGVVFRVRASATGWPRGAYRVRVERAD